MFQGMLLSSSVDINDYVMYIYGSYVDVYRDNTADPGDRNLGHLHLSSPRLKYFF